MANTITLKKRQERVDEHKKLIEQANEYFKANDLEKYNETLAKLKECEEAYENLTVSLFYDDFVKEDEPIKALITTYDYAILGHGDDKEDGKLKGVKPADRVRKFNLLKFCDKKGFDTDWQYKVSKLNQLMCLKTATELGFTADQVANINNTYYIKDKAKAIKLGETPTSTTQLCKMIQQCIDGILFKTAVDKNGVEKEGVNEYKALSYDVKYLETCYTTVNKKKRLTLKTAKDSFIIQLITDIMYRILTNSKYDLEYKEIKKDEPKVEVIEKK